MFVVINMLVKMCFYFGLIDIYFFVDFFFIYWIIEFKEGNFEFCYNFVKKKNNFV